MRTRLLLGWIALIGLSLCQAQPLAVANGGLTGQWFDPERSGEGFFVEVVEVDGAPHLAVSWFTYDSNGNQMWIVGSTPIEEDATRVEVPAFVTDGPVFGPNFDPDDVRLTMWGTLTFEFSGCDAGTVEYDSVLGFGSGTIDIVRLTSILDFDCALPPQPSKVQPGLWTVGDSPSVCFSISPDGMRVSRVGSGCGRTAPLGFALSIEDTFVSNGLECTVDFQSNAEIEILDDMFEIFVGSSPLPLIRVSFVENTSAQLIYNDGLGCQQTYSLSPIR